MDENPDIAPEIGPKSPLAGVRTPSISKRVCALIGGLIIPSWALVGFTYTRGSFWVVDRINILFLSGAFARWGAVVSYSIATFVRWIRS
jgi:hypothetical protein